MAAGTDEVNVKFGATIDDLKSKMGEVTGIFGKVLERFTAMAAVVGGGAAFKHVIDETNTLNAEAMKLSRTLGITGEDAGTLNTALDDIGTDADTYTGAFLKFNRALRTNSDEMRALGVDVDGLKNGQKDSNQVFMEAIQIVAQYKPGIDQTQVAMKLFGRSVDDVQKLMRLNSEKLEEAKKKNQELNLVITEEGVAASKKYKEAMNDVGDVMKGLEKTIGEAVIPIFTKSAEQLASIGPALVEGMKAAVTVFVEIWQDLSATVGEVVGDIIDGIRAVGGGIAEIFGGEAPSAMQIFRNVLAVVQIAWIGFRVSFQEVVNAVKVGLQLMGSGMVNFAAVAERALHLDFAGAKAAWQEAVADRNRILSEGVAKAVAIAQKGAEDMDKAAMKPLSAPQQGTPKGAPPGGTKTADIGKEDKGSGEKLAARLALLKAQNEAELNLDQEHLKEAQAIYDEAYKNNLLSIAEYYDAKLAIEKKGNDLTLATKRKELQDAADAEKAAQAKSGSAATSQDKAKYDTQALKFKTEQVKLQGEINVLEAQGVEASRAIAAERADAERKLADDLAGIKSTRTKAAADDEIQTETAVLEQKKALRQIDADDAFAVEKQIEQKSYDAALEQINAKRALIHGDQAQAIKERAQLDADAEAAERQHQQKLSTIDRAAQLERSKYSIQAQQSVQSSFATMVNDLLSGTKKIGDVFRQFGINVANTFTNLIAQKFTDRLFDVTGVNKLMDQMVSFVTNGIQKIVMKWTVGEHAKTAASTTGATTRAGVATTEQTTTQGVVVATTAIVEGSEAVKTTAVEAGAAIRTTTEVAAAATGKGLTIGGAIVAIGAKAWEAAAAVYAAIAAIPYVGPFLAPVAAVAAGATVLGFISNIASSEGGEYRVDKDRLNIVHKDETILPAPFAQGLRELVGKGGLKPLTDTFEQITSALAPDGGRDDAKRAAIDPNAPVPADAATSTVPPAPLPVEAPVSKAAPPADPIASLAPEQRPVPVDVSTSLAPPPASERPDVSPSTAAPPLPGASQEPARDAAIATAPVTMPQASISSAPDQPGKPTESAAPAAAAPVAAAAPTPDQIAAPAGKTTAAAVADIAATAPVALVAERADVAPTAPTAPTAERAEAAEVAPVAPVAQAAPAVETAERATTVAPPAAPEARADISPTSVAPLTPSAAPEPAQGATIAAAPVPAPPAPGGSAPARPGESSTETSAAPETKIIVEQQAAPTAPTAPAAPIAPTAPTVESAEVGQIAPAAERADAAATAAIASTASTAKPADVAAAASVAGVAPVAPVAPVAETAAMAKAAAPAAPAAAAKDAQAAAVAGVAPAAPAAPAASVAPTAPAAPVAGVAAVAEQASIPTMALPLAESRTPLAAEQRPVPADASISVAASAPAPLERSTPQPQGLRPSIEAPAPAAAPAEQPRPATPTAPTVPSAAAGAATPEELAPAPAAAPQAAPVAAAAAPAAVPAPVSAAPAAQPVAADAPASRVMDPPKPGVTAKPAAEQPAAKSGIPALVARFLGNDSTNAAATATSMAPRVDTPMAQKTWWQVPSSPLAQIQGMTPAAAAPAATQGSDSGGHGAAPVQLVGTSAGDFFIANRKHLLKVLGDAARDNRTPGR